MSQTILLFGALCLLIVHSKPHNQHVPDFTVVDLPDDDDEEEMQNWHFDTERHCWAHVKHTPSEQFQVEQLFPQIFCTGEYRIRKLGKRFTLSDKTQPSSSSPSIENTFAKVKERVWSVLSHIFS